MTVRRGGGVIPGACNGSRDKKRSIMSLEILQLVAKKRYVYGAIAFIWISIPALETASTAVTADIVNGRCRKFVLKDYALQKFLGFSALFMSYLLPTAVIILCYVRVVRALRSKVVSSSSFIFNVAASKCLSML